MYKGVPHDSHLPLPAIEPWGTDYDTKVFSVGGYLERRLRDSSTVRGDLCTLRDSLERHDVMATLLGLSRIDLGG